MKRSIQIIAAFTLPVRPQQRKRISVAGQKRKYLQEISRKLLKRQCKATYSFKITIESVSFSAYYPGSKSKKSR